MELKGSRTEQNLLNAFSGESMARNKYLFFAEKAKQENHPEVAELFEKMAQNEGMHGKLLYHYLKGVGGTAENLREAVDGEYGEWSRMIRSLPGLPGKRVLKPLASCLMRSPRSSATMRDAS